MKLPSLVQARSVLETRIPASSERRAMVTLQSHGGSIQIRCISECGSVRDRNYHVARSDWETIQRNRQHPSGQVDYSQSCDYDTLDAELADVCGNNAISHSYETRSRR